MWTTEQLSFGSATGRTVATSTTTVLTEESPGSMDTLPGNAWAQSGKTPSDGKCNRKQTASGKPRVRVKRRGKSSPHVW